MATPIGPIRFKVAWRDGRVVNAAPEFDDCAKLAARTPAVDQSRAGHRRPGLWRFREALVSRFYLTTAIDFVNSRPHLGTAYEKICADIIARDRRQQGIETRFLMGNDEHSQNVFKKAVEEGLDPLAYCDRMEGEFRSAWKALDLSFDDFIRTTEPRHKLGVTEMVRRLHAAGDIYEGVYEG